MSLYQLKQTQRLPISINEAWDFFSSPKNLQTITPDHMGFEIISGLSEKMFPGQLIQYKVRPVLGIPLTWLTEITYVNKPNYFVDEQRFGPYALWHHKHFFKEIEGGVEMVDVVDYKLPMGVLGRIAHAIFVKRQLETIFSYRNEKLVELFGKI